MFLHTVYHCLLFTMFLLKVFTYAVYKLFERATEKEVNIVNTQCIGYQLPLTCGFWGSYIIISVISVYMWQCLLTTWYVGDSSHGWLFRSIQGIWQWWLKTWEIGNQSADIFYKLTCKLNSTFPGFPLGKPPEKWWIFIFQVSGPESMYYSSLQQGLLPPNMLVCGSHTAHHLLAISIKISGWMNC